VIKRATTYFETEGIANLDATIEAVLHRLAEGDIQKVVVFTGTGNGVLKLLPRAKGFKICAASFAPNVPHRAAGAGVESGEVLQLLKENNVDLVHGNMPFEDIIVPDVRDPKIAAIEAAYDTLSGGLSLCVQAVIMCTEAGSVMPGEDVIAMCADTAVVVTGCHKPLMFSPFDGLEIREIVCKPRRLTLTRKPRYDVGPNDPVAP